MHINPADLLNSVKAYQDQGGQTRKATVEVKKNSHLQRPDEVILSNRGAELGAVANKVREASDIRQDKIKELAERVQSGNYYVNAYDIASKIIDTHKGILG